VNIEINGKETPLTMKLGYEGIAYFNNARSGDFKDDRRKEENKNEGIEMMKTKEMNIK